MDQRHVFFIGIGGIGVSGIAQLAMKKGARVSGSDIKESSLTLKLSSLGAAVYIGHEAGHIRGADLVVYSSAIKDDNPELRAARASGIPVMRRAEFLSELMKDKRVVAVTGAHGKTTTSSLCAKVLSSGGFDPVVAVGGLLLENGENVNWTQSEYFVAEADESDGTFLHYSPFYSIITNIDSEHMDFYQSQERLISSFSSFIRQTKPAGCVFYCQDDEVLSRLVADSGVRAVGYGLHQGAMITARHLTFLPDGLRFICCRGDDELGWVQSRLLGRHNVDNILAVIGVGMELGMPFELIRDAVAQFRGVQRRFQVKLDCPDLLVVDDYAHHPTEIERTIEAARVSHSRRLVVVFQPHRYSRVKLLEERFVRSFLNTDLLYITDIYPAGEDPLEGVSSQHMIERIRKETPVTASYVVKERISEELAKVIRPHDLVLFLGAGDITKVSDEFSARFQR